ncbi:MAG: hypothetical protein R3B70_31985 [Polyangiaceae bacterium]
MRLRSFSSTMLTLAASSLLAFSGGCVADHAPGAGDDLAAEAPSAAESDGTIDAFADETGALHFPSPDAFFNAIDAISEWDEADRRAWESSIGFVSFQTAFEDLMAEAEAMDDPEAATALLLAHPELVIVDGEEARPVIEAAGYAALSGADGVFYVESAIHKVLSEVIVSIDGGDRGALDAAVEELISSGMVVGEEVLSLPGGGIAARYAEAAGDTPPPDGDPGGGPPPPPPGCGSSKNAFYQTSTRKVDFTISTYRYVCSGCCGNFYNRVHVQWTLVGYKKGLFGGWKHYNTSYGHQNVGMSLIAPNVTGFNGVSSIFNYQTYNLAFAPAGSSGSSQSWTNTVGVGNQVQNAWIQIPYFDKVKGQGKSTGTGVGGWANICCGYAGGCGF